MQRLKKTLKCLIGICCLHAQDYEPSPNLGIIKNCGTKPDWQGPGTLLLFSVPFGNLFIRAALP